MFVVTMNRKGVKRLVIITCSLLLVCTTLIGGVILLSDDTIEVMANTDTQDDSVNGVEDVARIFERYGVSTDVTNAEVSSVVIPSSFNDDFTEFNQIIMEGGGDISRIKGKTVERWKVLTTNKSMKDETVWAIALVRNNKMVGSYLLCEPSGQVLSVNDESVEVVAIASAQAESEPVATMS